MENNEVLLSATTPYTANSGSTSYVPQTLKTAQSKPQRLNSENVLLNIICHIERPLILIYFIPYSALNVSSCKLYRGKKLPIPFSSSKFRLKCC